MTVLFIAVAYRSTSDVAQLLDSLQRNGSQDWQLVVADNSADSDGPELARLLATHPRAHYHDTGGNLGYFGGANSAFERYGTPLKGWTVVLNTDLTIADDFVSQLSTFERPEVGLVAPQIRNSHTGLDQNPYMTSPPSRGVALRRRLMLGNRVLAQLTLAAKRAAFRMRRTPTPRPIAGGAAIYAAHGSVLAFSREYFSRGGDLAHPLFLFGEEIYVADTCRRLDLDVVYRPDLRVDHRAHARTGRFRSWEMLGHMAKAARFTYKTTRAASSGG